MSPTNSSPNALSRRLKQESFEGPGQRALLNILVTADHLRRQMEGVCSEHGITNTQYNVLRILRGVHPNGHPRCEISDRLIEKAPDVTRLIQRLEKQGYVEKFTPKEDRRVAMSRVTRKGLALLEKMQKDIDRFDSSLESRFSRAELDRLSQICESIYSDEG